MKKLHILIILGLTIIGSCKRDTLPEVETLPANITDATHVTLHGNVINEGSTAVTNRGFCWGLVENPTTNDNFSNNGFGTGNFSENITVIPDTTYFIRGYALNSKGAAFGDQVEVNTKTILPIVTTSSISEVGNTSAKSGGEITSSGGFTIVARGVCWSTNQNPTLSDAKTIDGIGTGSFVSSLTDLLPNKKYYVRGYATNTARMAYGNEVNFQTSLVLPSIITSEITAIEPTKASSGGTITSDGGAEITARGVCWAKTANPTIADNLTIDGTGTGVFSSNLTGLIGNTSYFVRAYATNLKGTNYGTEVNFKTSPVLPTITTIDSTAITQTSASSGGNITNDGGADITTRGVCWSTTASPTTADSKTTDGTGTGLFTSSLTSLTGNTTYYVRAYAINSAGTSYGNEVSFKTSPVLPTVTTTAISYITQTTASSGGNATSDGGASITARGVCWSTTATPTIADSKTSDGTETGAFTSSLTGLTGNTTYYVRAFATNSIGTSYGDQLALATKSVLISDGTFTDFRDGHEYCFKKIGTQTWMIENLAYLPTVSPSSVGSDTLPFYYVYGYEGHDLSNAKTSINYSVYGVLYNWSAAVISCPSGWHLPNNEEWDDLIGFLGNSPGGKMKEIGTARWWNPNSGANNLSCFTAVPSGQCDAGYGFQFLNRHVLFWMPTEILSTSAKLRGLYYDFDGVSLNETGRSAGYSVRCLKD